MRNPVKLYRDLGLVSFLAFHAFIGGVPVSALKNLGLTELKDALGDAVAQVQRQDLARQEEARVLAAQYR